jgi:hypothetical protein
MNTLSPFGLMDCSCDETLKWAQMQLSRAGLRAMQTFDLHSARHHSLEGCPCPNHGTNACDCQMVVMLVYGETTEPVTLILHGNDGKTWISFAANFSQRIDAKLQARIGEILQNVPTK